MLHSADPVTASYKSYLITDPIVNSCDIPLKKRKCDFQANGSTAGHFGVTLINATHMVLQLPPNSNTNFPIWDSVQNSQVEVLWKVTPYKIDICIVPLSTVMILPKSDSHTVPEPQNNNFPPSTPDLASIFYEPVPKDLWINQATFLTKQMDNIKICDKFLLGCCTLNFDCIQHHTPYPFHWQLRRNDTYQWVSVSYAAQMHLEKLYCNADKDIVTLQDSNHTCTLDLVQKTILDSNIYNKARRLSNTSDAKVNPHFHTTWRIYWWNDYGWEKYKNSIVNQLEEKVINGESSCLFTLKGIQYMVDFVSLTQKNTLTGYVRKIKRRPVFRPLHTLLPHLKTLMLSEVRFYGQPLPQVRSGNPLDEFTSWYPPVWTPSFNKDEFTKIEVKQCEEVYLKIHQLFHKTMLETEVEIVNVYQIQNTFLWDKYRRQKEFMCIKYHDCKDSIERHLFHGTTEATIDTICKMNFDPRVAGKNGIAYGRGSYFARDASYSNGYAHKNLEGFQFMFLAKVLIGKTDLGKKKYYRPPPIHPKCKESELYDACVDQRFDPAIFVVFDSCQCYPFYLIKYRTLPNVINIFQ
ncbi:protein mono-ADP-ribosyltransferase TIPARP-like isoform X1 [Erpetoichthys calabaricus]|uniref:Poly [ADP-ribose] polymerase n=1 Tax=Erpetoichthys calabaricus TaxID=27687 RepID=A0A8C4X8I1_ERPCA|nr:protein mono-ADP-ribosyltransferase TIPARP-like isoform X1 [Erpetoichthys calabaricus]XP_051785445.1 protein mono-ADP-ribosyltransferase TIPARP-like isoform X1 [Erpetoichthys calabaricus]